MHRAALQCANTHHCSREHVSSPPSMALSTRAHTVIADSDPSFRESSSGFWCSGRRWHGSRQLQRVQSRALATQRVASLQVACSIAHTMRRGEAAYQPRPLHAGRTPCPERRPGVRCKTATRAQVARNCRAVRTRCHRTLQRLCSVTSFGIASTVRPMLASNTGSATCCPPCA